MTSVSPMPSHVTNGKADHDPALDFPTSDEQATTYDPFNPANLRLTQDFATSVGVKKMMLTVPVRKPDKAEMMRLACCLATERGVTVCDPIHDALMIEADDHEIDDAVAVTQDAMREAAETVLDGFTLRTDAKVVRHPDRYLDPRGIRMWDTVQGILADLSATAATF